MPGPFVFLDDHARADLGRGLFRGPTTTITITSDHWNAAMTHRRFGPGDLAYGLKAIGEHLGISTRQALHLVAMGRLPHFHQGRVVCARRSSLDAWLAKAEQEAAARTGAAVA